MKPTERAPCPDCDEAARQAYSDATTPGFFSPYCEKHRAPLLAEPPAEGIALCGIHGKVRTTERGECAECWRELNPAERHEFYGGGGDVPAGRCTLDGCGQPRSAPVHAQPEPDKEDRLKTMQRLGAPFPESVTEAQQPLAPGEQRTCIKHCEHDVKFYHVGEKMTEAMCWHEDIDGFCGHRCEFAPVSPSTVEGERLTTDAMRGIVELVSFPGYTFTVSENNGTPYLQALYQEPDIVTGEASEQKTRKWQLSEFMVKSEIVQTAFKCILTSAEHTVREHFLYRGERVFGPHFDIEALYEIAKARRLDYRK